MQTTPEAETVRELYRTAEGLTHSDIPVVRDLAIAIMAHAKLLAAELLPDEFEHVRIAPER